MLNAVSTNGTVPAVPETIASADFCKAMRQLAGACVVIASGDDRERAGLTATAVCSITAEPPRLLICVNRNVRANAVIQRAGAFSINVLGAEQEAIAKRFAGMVEGVFGEARFTEGDWRNGVTGVPVFDDALISFECRLVEQIVASTHDMFIGEVVGLAGQRGEGGPLVYFNSQFAALRQA
ncbi:MFS transporter [Stutzerimonas balearica]|uniref:flavin reductase family protein n=1 Tax=Stutzerimonas balearica TaxID=74829 RepID=UPI00077318FE|nr:flavin reductase family protein [Stutzerimonas balearica]OMG66326.1 MFS transporter [Stutzerimonas balearica]